MKVLIRFLECQMPFIFMNILIETKFKNLSLIKLLIKEEAPVK